LLEDTLSFKDLWKLGANDSIRVDASGRATVDIDRFVQKDSVKATVESLRTHRTDDVPPAPPRD
jgi:hypothetical protein